MLKKDSPSRLHQWFHSKLSLCLLTLCVAVTNLEMKTFLFMQRRWWCVSFSPRSFTLNSKELEEKKKKRETIMSISFSNDCRLRTISPPVGLRQPCDFVWPVLKKGSMKQNNKKREIRVWNDPIKRKRAWLHQEKEDRLDIISTSDNQNWRIEINGWRRDANKARA